MPSWLVYGHPSQMVSWLLCHMIMITSTCDTWFPTRSSIVTTSITQVPTSALILLTSIISVSNKCTHYIHIHSKCACAWHVHPLHQHFHHCSQQVFPLEVFLTGAMKWPITNACKVVHHKCAKRQLRRCGQQVHKANIHPSNVHPSAPSRHASN